MGKVFTALMLCLGLASSAAFGAEKEWTMLVYLNGHNSLDSFGQVNVDQMAKVGSTKDINVVVQWASTSYGKTRRVLVNKNNAKVLEELAPVDMGDYKSLVEFVKWGVARYPAKHYFIDVWNHGNGWKLESLTGGMHVEDISYDDLSGHSINSQELGEAMKEAKAVIGHNVDLYGSDACLMQMVEVDYELAGSVDYVVGSEETEPGAGWVYDKLLSQWGKTPQEIGTTLAKTYTAAYPDVTMSVVDLSKMADLADSLKDLRIVLESSKGVAASADSALWFTFQDYVDLGDFLKNEIKADPSTKPAAAAVQAAMKQFIVASYANGSKSAANGLSIWIPTSSTSDMTKYKGLAFPQATGWDSFLEKLWK